MSVNTILSLLSRKSLLFLCVTVGSVVFFPQISFGATEYVSVITASTTAPQAGYMVTMIPDEDFGLSFSKAYFSTSTSYDDISSRCPSPITGTVSASAHSDGFSFTSARFTGACSSAGTYYWTAKQTTTGKLVYAKVIIGSDLYVQSGTTTVAVVYSTGFNSVLNTRFLDLDITGTSTVNFDADYYLDGDEIDMGVSSKNPAWVKFWYSPRASSTDFAKINEPISVVAGSSTVNTNLSGLTDGVYDLLVGFSNFGCSVGLSDCPFSDSYIYSSFTITSGVLSATGTIEFYDKTSTEQENIYKSCGLFDIGGCLINAGMFLFVPDNASIEQISSSFTSLQSTFPFVYAFQANDYVDTLFTATSTDAGITASTTWGTITFVDRAKLQAVPYSSTFRTIIGYGMWLTFLWGAYRLVLRMFNPTTV